MFQIGFQFKIKFYFFEFNFKFKVSCFLFLVWRILLSLWLEFLIIFLTALNTFILDLVLGPKFQLPEIFLLKNPLLASKIYP